MCFAFFFFCQIQLTDAILEEQLRYLPSGESSSSRQARLSRAFCLPASPCNSSSFDAPESLKPHAAVSNDNLGKIHQPRENFVFIIDVRESDSRFLCSLFVRDTSRISLRLCTSK